MSFFKFFNKVKTRSAGTIGLSFMTDGISLALVNPGKRGEIHLSHCEFVPCGAGSERLENLKTIAERHQLAKFNCHLALAPQDYRLLQVEAPNVPDEEMKDAIPWCVQDLIEFPVDQAVIDYFQVPKANQHGRARTLTVVVTRRDVIADYTRLCEQADLALNVVDIQEMALRNLAVRMPENERGVAIVYLRDSEGMILLEKEADVYLSRKIEFDPKNFIFEHDADDTLQRDDFALEVQRSLDYYERQFAQPPISSLVVTPIETGMNGLLDYLNKNLGATSRILDVSGLLDCERKIDDATQARCLPAIGAAIRG